MRPTFQRSRGRSSAVAVLVLGSVLALAGCSPAVQRGFLPEQAPGATNHTDTVIQLWNGSWIAALAVAVLVWGLILWCVVVYRRRQGDNELPVQLRYHVPLELMYTFIPILMVGVLFFFTQRSMGEITDTSADADVHIEVYGKRWSWDFNYLDDDVYYSGVQAVLTGEEGVQETLPTLVLPQGELIEFTLNSRDVIHAFWIPAFLFKLDMIPGHENSFQVVANEVGTYQGKCAELCGEYHSEMLFNVEVVPREEYDAYIESLRELGNTGRLGEELNVQQNVETTGGRD